MNNKIMELIKDYTDKTIFEGCYRQFEDERPSMMREPFDTQDIYDGLEGTDSKILGHYDITAVLKYIRLKDFYMENGAKYIFVSYHKGELIGDFPNKPLHLYTEEEQTNLLELLKKLGNK